MEFLNRVARWEHSSSSSNNNNKLHHRRWWHHGKGELQKKPFPPLTTTRRLQLEKEIALLETLAESDEAATELSKLWIKERGSNAANALQIAQTLLQAGALQQAETVLTLMIQEEGVHFVAPLSQLASLYYIQGRLQESKDLHELVLEQKPWFLNSLVGIHEVCKRMDNAEKELAKWDRELIPPLEEKHRSLRSAWVQRMVDKAKGKLDQAEQGLHSFFDDEGYYSLHGSEGSVLVEDENSWQ